MCIRDSLKDAWSGDQNMNKKEVIGLASMPLQSPTYPRGPCLLYTSDAADERSSVDLGGRRIIKKKK